MKAESLSAVRLPNQSARIMRGAVAQRGLSWGAVCSAAQVEAAALEQPIGLISGADELRLQETVAQATRGDTQTWFEMGLRYRLMAYGPLGLALLSARDVAQAVRIVTTHQELTFSLLTYRPLEEGGMLRGVIADDCTVPDDIREFCVMRDLGAVRMMLNDMLQSPFPLERVSVSIPAPAGWQEFGQQFGCPVEFNAPRTIWEFKPGIASHPLPMADALLAESYLEQCEHETRRSRQVSDVGAALFALFLDCSGHFPSADEAARQLGLSKRTLHRRLSEQNSSFGEVLDCAREQRARQLLSRSRLPMETIGDLLGFSEAASFTRAFKRWTGMPPLQFRKTADPDRPAR